jgi:hypothetical protein
MDVLSSGLAGAGQATAPEGVLGVVLGVVVPVGLPGSSAELHAANSVKAHATAAKDSRAKRVGVDVMVGFQRWVMNPAADPPRGSGQHSDGLPM